MNGIIVFCIECQEMVSAECYEPFGCSHAVFTPIQLDNGQYIGIDSDLCFFPCGWATCPPPEIPEAFAIPPQDESVPEIMQALALI